MSVLVMVEAWVLPAICSKFVCRRNVPRKILIYRSCGMRALDKLFVAPKKWHPSHTFSVLHVQGRGRMTRFATSRHLAAY